MRNSIRIICLCSFALLCLWSCAEPEKEIRFAIASDFHAPDVPDGRARLESFIQTAKDEKVYFIIELGDFCRLDSASQSIREIWNGFEGDKYHVIGNHDMDQYNSMTYDKPLYAIVTLSNKDAVVKGTKADFVPPTPKELQMRDSIGVYPLVSIIEDVKISFR